VIGMTKHFLRARLCLTSAELSPIKIFLALQIADVATTVIFMAMGIGEANPLASHLMTRFGPLLGLISLKLAAICIALVCKAASHPTFVRRINIFYMVIVLVNVFNICRASRA
jgi:uncharacterized membrane protein